MKDDKTFKTVVLRSDWSDLLVSPGPDCASRLVVSDEEDCCTDAVSAPLRKTDAPQSEQSGEKLAHNLIPPVQDVPKPIFCGAADVHQANWSVLASAVGSGLMGFLTEEDRAAAAAGAFLSKLGTPQSGGNQVPVGEHVPRPSFCKVSALVATEVDWSVLPSNVGSDCVGFLTGEDRAAAAAASLLARISRTKPAADVAACCSRPPDAKDVPPPVLLGVDRIRVDSSDLPGNSTSDCANLIDDRAVAAATALLNRLGDRSGYAQFGRVGPISKHVPTPRFCAGQPSDNKEWRVKFALEEVTVHAVTPYSEIYGRHPREFVFDKDCCMIPAAFGGFVQEGFTIDDDEACDSDTEAEDAIMNGWDSFLRSDWHFDDELDGARATGSSENFF
jgi:hypothetical protein